MSRFEFKLPDIGEGVTEGEIVSWLVKAGEPVTQDQEMVEVMTDKATVTIGAPKPGKIVEIMGKEGDVVPVGSVLVVLDVEDGADQPRKQDAEKRAAPTATAVGDLKESLPGMARAEDKPAGPSPKRDSTPPQPAWRPSEPVRIDTSSSRSDGGTGARAERQREYFNDKPLAAPATRKLARELGVDLHRVQPSGPAGRVTREDVEKMAHAREAPRSGATPQAEPEREAPALTAAPAPAERAEPAGMRPAPGGEDVERRIPIRGLRKRIYENMARSKHTAAHFTYVDECDATALKQMRERAKAHAAEQGVTLSFLPYIVKAVVAALRRHPALNCLVDDAAQEMVLRGTYDIGIAAATESGLTVPVVRGADRLSLLEMSREIDRLAAEARAGKTRREDLGGSSFTITSLGKLGGLFATPIVNYPEVAILGVHEMKRRPVVKDDQIVIADVMLLSLSFDHRIIDGHVGAAFAQEVVRLLEQPDRMMLEMR